MSNRHLFEVWRNGKCLFWTDSPACIPDKQTQRSIKKSGCTIKRNK